MPPVRTLADLINGMEFRSRARGRLIADTATAEGKVLGMLQAADEIERLTSVVLNEDGDMKSEDDYRTIIEAWVKATREAAAMSAHGDG